VAEQLAPPPGDDPDLAVHVGQLAMRIKYLGQPPYGNIPGWAPLDQTRPLTYLQADSAALWDIARRSDVSLAPNERYRIQQELDAVTWVRNVHAQYQVREFLADFWNNHFAVGRDECIYGTAALPIYDAQVIRPRVFGNFRDLLGAVARSASMLRFLNNSESTADHPNENYARELLELHSLGAPAYLGLSAPALLPTVDAGGVQVAPGFTDQDIIQASRALSGWTLEQGQMGPSGPLPFTGKFVFNPVQHNAQAGMFMGVDLSRLSGMAQGETILDIVAAHPATADFIVRKLARRIFGDNPSEGVIAGAKGVWTGTRDRPDQLKQVTKALLLSNAEIGLPPTKVRRPYERLMALLRTTDTVVNAYDNAWLTLSSLGDGLFVWATPEGRPDVDSQWLTAAANLETWNTLLQVLQQPAMRTSFADQTPRELAGSATGLVEYWVGRMVGRSLRPAAMQALIDEALTPIGVVAAYRSGGIANIENALRRQAALIAASPEFGMR
jgi:uncharacterized protein (DUF1800 family)